MRTIPPPNKQNVLSLAVVIALSLPTLALSQDFQIEDFPNLADWTIAGSGSESFSKQKLQTVSNWGLQEYRPITSSFSINENTLIFADESAIFKQNYDYFFHSERNENLVFDIGESTLRILNESDRAAAWGTTVRLEKNSSIRFEGTENSTLQVSSHGMRWGYVEPNATLEFDVGNAWFQFATDVGNPATFLQIQSGGITSIKALNDITILADTELTGQIRYVIQSIGNLTLDAKRIYIGIQNADNSIGETNVNRLITIESGGELQLGSDRTELISLNGARVGLQLISDVNEFSLKTKKLQIIGDGHKDSIAINYSNTKVGNFYAQEAYVGNTSKGIYINYGAASMKFDYLWNLASTQSVDVESGDLILQVNEAAYFDKTVYAKDGCLTLDRGEYLINDAIILDAGSRLLGNAKTLKAKQILANDASLVNMDTSNFYVGSNNEDLEYALSISSESKVNLNTANSSDITVQIENDIVVANKGTINANFANANSHFIGTVFNQSTGNENINQENALLSFKNGAFWRITDNNSQSVDLTLNDAQVFLNQSRDGQESTLTTGNAVTLSLNSLSGENGLFYLRTSLQETYGDSILIKTATGNHKLMLASSGSNPTEDSLRRALVTQGNGNAKFSLANDGGVVDLGNYVYGLTSTQTENGTEWHLTDQTPQEPDPDPEVPSTPELSPSATAVLAVAGSGAQTTQFLHSLSDLRKRMGDIRYGASDGLYAGVRGGKDRLTSFASTSFKSEYGALSLGYDRKLSDQWIIGMSFEAIEGEQTVKSRGYRASGEDSTQSLKGYATWFNDIGCYADFVVGISYFDQDINTRMLDGTKVKGNYDSFGFGASVEVGKKFSIGAENAWFIEPQLQLAYFKVQGEDFSLSNGMIVEQKNADSLTGRLGLVVGKTFLNYDGSGYQISAKTGINHEFLPDSDIYINDERFSGDTLGTRGYYGVGFDWYVDPNMRIYAQVEREEGSHYTGEVNARIGLKYHF